MPNHLASKFVAPIVNKPLLVLDEQALVKVSGAGPHGGWVLPVEATVALQAGSNSGPSFGPHGGW